MALSNKEIAKELIVILGGKDNIKSVSNCMTRLHLEINDTNKIDEKALNKLEGVLGVVPEEDYQIIFGPGKVVRIHDEVQSLLINDTIQGVEDLESIKISPTVKFLKSFMRILIPIVIVLAVILIGVYIYNSINSGYIVYDEFNHTTYLIQDTIRSINDSINFI